MDWQREWGGNVILSHGSSSSAGVGFLFSKSFLPVSLKVEEVIAGRLLKVIVSYERKTLVLLNVYAPVNARERMLFLEKLSDTLEGCKSEDLLFLAGDFNCTVNNLDRNHVEPHLASRNKLVL